MNTIVRDVLFYLPDWSAHPSTGTKAVNRIEPFLSDEDLGEVKVAKHVAPREVLVMYKRAENLLLMYTGQNKVPDHPVYYQATCTYAAGLLYNKYSLKEQTEGKNLIDEAKDLVKPFILVTFKGLHNNRHHFLNHRKPSKVSVFTYTIPRSVTVKTYTLIEE